MQGQLIVADARVLLPQCHCCNAPMRIRTIDLVDRQEQIKVCIALQIGASDDDVKQAIANKVIAFAKAGVRNPDILCERVLKDIRRPQD